MKFNRIVTGALATLGLLLSASAATWAQNNNDGPRNFVRNGSFEEVTNGRPQNFRFEDRHDNAEIELDDSVARTGERSIRIAGEGEQLASVAQTVRVQGGETYRFSFWYKADDDALFGMARVRLSPFTSHAGWATGGRLEFDMDWLEGGDDMEYHNWGGYLVIADTELPQEWKELHATFTLPRTVQSMEIMVDSQEIEGTIWIDDVSLIRAEDYDPEAAEQEAQQRQEEARADQPVRREAPRRDQVERGEHPYLYFTADEIPELRQRVQAEPYAVRWQVLLSNANSILNQDVADSPRYHLGNAATTAFVYVITGDERYGHRAIEEAMAMVGRDFNFWAERYHYNRGANLNTSHLAFGVALVYDWCHDLLTEEQKRTIVAELEQKSIRPYLVSTDREPKEWWYRHAMNNWRGVCHGAHAVASLAIYHESERAQRAAEIAYENVPLVFEDFIRADSGGLEGIGYHNYGMVYAGYGLMAQQRFFGGHEGTFEEMSNRLAGYWDVYTQGPDLYYANIGRTGIGWQAGLWGQHPGQFEGGPNSELAALYESWVGEGDELLLWAADNGGTRHYWRGGSPMWFLFRRDNAASRHGQERPELQPAVLFRGNGHAVLSSPDEDAPRPLWMTYSGGLNHNAQDLGAYVLVVGEERFIHLPEVNQNDVEDQSTLMVNGAGQAQVREGSYHRFGSGDGFHYFASDLSDVYEDETLERFVRHVVMVTRAGGAEDDYVLILDDLAASEPAEFESRVQTRKQNVSTASPSGKIEGDTATLHLLTAGSQELQVELGEKLQNFFAIKPAERTEEVTMVTVLYPADPDAEAPQVSFDNGTVTVGADTLEFERDNGLWMLQSVNGEDATDIPTGEERNIEPLRPAAD